MAASGETVGLIIVAVYAMLLTFGVVAFVVYWYYKRKVRQYNDGSGRKRGRRRCVCGEIKRERVILVEIIHCIRIR